MVIILGFLGFMPLLGTLLAILPVTWRGFIAIGASPEHGCDFCIDGVILTDDIGIGYSRQYAFLKIQASFAMRHEATWLWWEWYWL